MDVARERELLRLVEESLDRPPDERARFLATATDDDGLRREVAALVERDESAGDLPAVEVPAEALDGPGAPPPGTTIDGFELVGPIGAGGMGRVFEARQLEPPRRVALKTLRLGLDSEDARRRFAFEAEVLARLVHPNIAQVWAVGSFREEGLGGPRQVPYFAMEFVEGARDLVTYAEREGLGREARLALFAEVCGAVQHGHDRGVLHRDLKASNILVDGGGRVKVIDFGIARSVDAESDESGSSLPRTVTGAIYGTPASLSPEQLAGGSDLDVRADVYGLGVVLYRLICGEPPHALDGLSLPRAARRVTEHEPRRASQLTAGVPRDLDAVLWKAVARERDDRYPSVAALADDVRRFLASEPVEARPPGPIHHLGLLARRHRVACAAGVVAALAVVGGSTASAVFGVRAMREAERAHRAGLALADEAAKAVAAEREARAAEAAAVAAAEQATRARGELAALGMDFVFEYADPIANLQGATEVRSQLLRSGIEHLERLEDLLLDDADQTFDLVRAYLKLGDVLGASTQANIGDFEGRAAAHERAFELMEHVALTWPDDPRVATFRASVLSRLGRARLDADDRDGAAQYFERALEEARALEESRSIDAELADDIANALSNYGAIRGMAGDDAFALEAFEECRAIRGRLMRQNPGRFGFALRYAHATAQTGAALNRNGRPDAAIERYEEAVDLFDALEREQPDNDLGVRGGIETRSAFCTVHLEHDRPDAVERLVTQALACVERLAALDDADVSVHRMRGDLRYSLGQAQLLRAAAAEGAEQEALHLEAARTAFGASRSSFEALRDGGGMLPRERGYFALIDGQLATVEAGLAKLR